MNKENFVMNKPIRKKNRGMVNAAFLLAAVVMMMMAVAGCRDSHILTKEQLDEQLINAGGEAWGIVCAASSGQRCEPVATRAIAFNRDGTAIVYTVADTSWSRWTQVRWATTGNTLYITYSFGVVRYAFVIADGLLTLRTESSADGNNGYLTVGGAIAGYEKNRIPPAPHPVVFTSSAGGTVSITSAGAPIVSGTEIREGTVLTITATPLDGHALSTLTVNGQPFVSGTAHTVNGTLVVAATFAAPVTFTADTGGALSVTKSDGVPITSGEAVPVGTVLAVTAVPEMNYRLETLTVNGEAFVNGASFVVGGATEIAAAFAVVTYPVTFTASAGGTLSVTSDDVSIDNGTTVPVGTVLTITAVPNANYALSTLTVNGQQFDNGETHIVAGAVEIVATFSIPGAEAHPVTFTAGTGGTLSIARSDGVPTTSGALVPVSTVLTITATPLDGYVLSRLTVNGQLVNNGATHTVNGTVMISATFAAPVTFGAGKGGTLSIVRLDGVSITSGAVVPVGTVLTVTVAPDPGFVFSTLTVDGQSVVNGVTHTVNSPMVVSATFAALVTYTASAGGTLSVTSTSANVPINSGTAVPVDSVLTITATPLDGYDLLRLTVNGQSVMSGVTPLAGNVQSKFAANGQSYTATHVVNGPVEVSATFAASGSGTILDAGPSLVSASDASWLLTDGSQFVHNGISYANSATFRENGAFWQVAIPLNNSGNINLNTPANYLELGTYEMVGDSIRVWVPALTAIGEDPKALSGKFAVSDSSNANGEKVRVLRLWNDGKSEPDIFIEQRGVRFVYEPDIATTMRDLSSDLFD